MEKAYLDSIQTLRYTVEAKDPYTRGHSDRVAEYSVLIGEKLGLSEDDIKTLRVGGLFHDIGKIGIPDSILLKESKLTDDDGFCLIENVVYGMYDMKVTHQDEETKEDKEYNHVIQVIQPMVFIIFNPEISLISPDIKDEDMIK